MKKLDIKRYKLGVGGKHCFINRGVLADEFAVRYDRPSVALKIFDLQEVKTIEDFYQVKWGDDPAKGDPQKNNKIFEASQIQNILAWHGLSSRVYGLETVLLCDKNIPAQVIEYQTGDFWDNHHTIDQAYAPVDKIGKMYGFHALVKKISCKDVIDKKLIDPQPYFFYKPYEETVKEIYFNNKYGPKTYYQDVPELGLSGGPRKSLDRIKYLALDKVDFTDKRVADVGCAGGFFTRYAIDRGAKRAVGFDYASQVEAARNMANYLGYFNNDYIPLDLTKDQWDVKDFDIVFYLSMNFHIGIPQQILEAKMVILEDNGRETRRNDKLGEPWTSNFDVIEFVGRAQDHDNKACYHLYKRG